MFHMNEHTDINALKNAIDQIAFRGGTTHTDRGLKSVETAFDKINGGRDGVKNVLIVMTDGKSHNQNLTKEAADSIHQKDIDVFTIGIGNETDKTELEYIASNPHSNVFTVDDFDSLSNILHRLTEGTCKVIPTAEPSPATPGYDCDLA